MPEAIFRDGYAGQYNHRQVSGDEKTRFLVQKLREEVEEVERATTTDNFVEELADVVEVCFALAGQAQVEDARLRKVGRLGAFNLGLVGTR